MNKMKIASVIFLLSTFVLKFSSMIRDLVIAGLFGDSYQADAYFAAMAIPNALSSLSLNRDERCISTKLL